MRCRVAGLPIARSGRSRRPPLPFLVRPHRGLEFFTEFGELVAADVADLFNFVTSVLGDDVLMYASDYPHSECQFPDSVDNILRWGSLKPDTRRKLLWDNAARFYKQT